MTPERRHSLVRGFAVIEGAQPAEQTSECDTPAELKTLPSIWFANEYRRSNARVRVGHQHAGPPARGDRTAPTPYCRCCCSPTSRQPRDGFLVYSPTCAVIRGLSCTRSIGHRRGSPSAAPTDMPCAARPSRRRGRHGGRGVRTRRRYGRRRFTTWCASTSQSSRASAARRTDPALHEPGRRFLGALGLLIATRGRLGVKPTNERAATSSSAQ
jgi:hypothetical protein